MAGALGGGRGALASFLLQLALSVLLTAWSTADGKFVSGTGIHVNDDGSAVVYNAIGFQTALVPNVLSQVGKIFVTSDVLLDPFAFVPTLVLDRELSVCGSTPDVLLTAVEEFPLMNVNATLKWCNVSFDMTFLEPDRQVRVDTMLLDVGPLGTVEYRDVGFLVPRGAFSEMTDALRQLNATVKPKDMVATIDTDTISIGVARFPSTVLERVKITLVEGHGPKPRISGTVNDTKQLANLREARRRGAVPVDITIGANITVTRCLMKAISGHEGQAAGRPMEVHRPLTLRGRESPRTWLKFSADVRRQFLDIRSQVRFVGLDADYRDLDLMILGNATLAPGCSASTCLLDKQEAHDALRVQNSSVFHYDNTLPGCRLVMKDMTAVYSCEFIRGLQVLQFYLKKGIQVGTPLLQSLDELAQVSNVDIVNSSAMYYHRYVGGGVCIQNTWVICRGPELENLKVPMCEAFGEEQGTDPEVTSSYDESVLYEETSSFGSTSSAGKPRYDGDEHPGLLSQSPKDPQGGVSNAVLIAIAAAVLFLVMGALLITWKKTTHGSRKEKCRQKDTSELREIVGPQPSADSGLKGVWSEGAKYHDGDDEFTSLVTGKRQGSYGAGKGRGHELTRESLIGAISLASAEIEDNAATIDTQIAAGGSGIVYKGTWKGIPVAIKTVVFQDVADETNKQRQRAVFEAAISSSVAHKNIVQTYAYSFKKLESLPLEASDFKGPNKLSIRTNAACMSSIIDWKLYIVQEFCNAGSLRECLDNKLFIDKESGRANLSTVCQIAEEAALGMNHLHTHNIVHGDLSTKNILLRHEVMSDQTIRWVAKIADFGLSIKMDRRQNHVSNRRAGTPFYMAPELCHQGKLSKKADIFSFGVFLWELYHSRKCYHMNPKSGMQYHPLFPKFPIVCPIPYAMLCVACISPKPDERPNFDFVVKVFAALRKQIEDGHYSKLQEVRVTNMRLAAGLGKIAGPQILQMIADQVGIEATDNSSLPGCSVSLHTDCCQHDTKAGCSPSGSSLLNSPMSSARGFSDRLGLYMSQSKESEVHLNQADIAPLHCVMTVDRPRDLEGGDNEEHISLTWKSEREKTPWGSDNPKEQPQPTEKDHSTIDSHTVSFGGSREESSDFGVSTDDGKEGWNSRQCEASPSKIENRGLPSYAKGIGRFSVCLNTPDESGLGAQCTANQEAQGWTSLIGRRSGEIGQLAEGTGKRMKRMELAGMESTQMDSPLPALQTQHIGMAMDTSPRPFKDVEMHCGPKSPASSHCRGSEHSSFGCSDCHTQVESSESQLSPGRASLPESLQTEGGQCPSTKDNSQTEAQQFSPEPGPFGRPRSPSGLQLQRDSIGQKA